jgi:copper chaperone CopZ
MKFNKLVNGIIITTTAAFLLVMAFHVNTGATTNSIAVLKTSGMTCSSCSKTISQALERLDGVANTEVDVEGGWVVVGYDTKTIKPETLAVKVSDAGFVSKVHLVLTPEQFKQVTGKDMGAKAAQTSGCCGSMGSCGTKKKN